jgi:hypothetical protein
VIKVITDNPQKIRIGGINMKTKLNWEAKRHNGQASYGEWIHRDEVIPSHREWIDTSIIDGELKDGDVIRVEGGTMYRIKFKKSK